MESTYKQTIRFENGINVRIESQTKKKHIEKNQYFFIIKKNWNLKKEDCIKSV